MLITISIIMLLVAVKAFWVATATGILYPGNKELSIKYIGEIIDIALSEEIKANIQIPTPTSQP